MLDRLLARLWGILGGFYHAVRIASHGWKLISEASDEEREAYEKTFKAVTAENGKVRGIKPRDELSCWQKVV